MSFITSFIRKFDAYGVIPTFNFNQSGDSVTSLPGGIVSILVKIVSLSYLAKLTYTMYIYGDDTIATNESIIKLDEIGEIEYESTNMLFYFSMLSSDL